MLNQYLVYFSKNKYYFAFTLNISVINYCDNKPCLNGGSCVSGVHSYKCNCVPGYTGYNCQTRKSIKTLLSRA